MPRIKYKAKRFGVDATAIINQANRICTEYAHQGYDLTLRQLYYQFVARGLLPNRQTEYDRLGGIINDARMAGLIDWNYIVDRTRNLKGLLHFSSPADRIKRAADNYFNDKWAEQDIRVEVWIEKDALVGVLDNVCPALDVSYFSCRGYTSASEMWAAAQRLRTYLNAGQRVVILHLGDHDPSGVDMTRDIRDRLEMFVLQDWINEHHNRIGAKAIIVNIWDDMAKHMRKPYIYNINKKKPLEVKRIALTMEQVEEFNPPPNPAKLSDSRAKKYIEQYGRESWELDALDPVTLSNLIRNAVTEERDEDRWGEALRREQTDRGVLRQTARRWAEVRSLLTKTS